MIPKFIFQSCENLVKKPWGGNYIGKLKGINVEGVGEAWEFSAHPSRPSLVLGMRFDELVKKYKSEILGNLRCDYFPLLVKIIDANENLSVQVHPSEEQAKMLNENDHGKEE
ncbi:MAG TPA: mannose-6-phosphate isomerase, partial [Archaeoglobus profundus]|nr:mannose-6-phosphate isomerase [Archaeoglobus profundus]